MIENYNLWAIGVGIFMGTMGRYLLLEDDYRNYPSYPNGYLIHLTVGFVAAALGSVAIPAIINEDYVAVTFLALAIQQFREVRKMEKNTLIDLETTEQIPRGRAYIDGLAKSFEARNYIVLLTSLVVSGTILLLPVVIWIRVIVAVLFGLLVIYSIRFLTSDGRIGSIADIEVAELRFEEESLYVDDIFLTNVGLPEHRERVLKQAIGILIKPTSIASAITLANVGTRQAIIHEVGRVLGVQRFYGTRRDFDTGNIGMFVVLMHKDESALMQVIKQVPLIESIRREKFLKTDDFKEHDNGG